jgi:hypothetical protein
MINDGFGVIANVFAYTRERSTSDPRLDQLSTSDWALASLNHNLIVTNGKILTARLMADESNFDTGLTHCEVGTDSATPGVANTNIGTVTKRSGITRVIRNSNVVQFRTFYAASDVTAHLRKTGMYGSSDATDTDQSGLLFNAALIDLDNSAGTKDITVVHEITFG